MVGRNITATDVGKHAKIIKVAQEELSNMDVLVCGSCLVAFHFIEEFRQHKLRPCSKDTSNIRDCDDTKPKIWAFLLWKATQLNNAKDRIKNIPNSWSLYQTWVKMDDHIRETWVVAGKTIQSFSKLGGSNLRDMPVKITKTVVSNAVASFPSHRALTPGSAQLLKLKATASDTEKEFTSLKNTSTNNKIIKKSVVLGQLQLKSSLPPISITDSSTSIPNITTTNTANSKDLCRRGKRTLPNSGTVVDENVEKIVAKRFNPRRRMHEYLVKWESQLLHNSWEPATHLEDVPHFLETFEKQLARQKEARAALEAKQAAATNAASSIATDAAAATITPSNKSNIVSTGNTSKQADISKIVDLKKESNIVTSNIKGNISERPQRSSKTKAMDQVKHWVSGVSATSSIKPLNLPITESNDVIKKTGMTAVKRKSVDPVSFQLTNNRNISRTTEDLEDDLIPSHTLKKIKCDNSISVELKPKEEEEIQVLTLNGTNSLEKRKDIYNKSADVIITQDVKNTGLLKKPNMSPSNSSHKTEAPIRILSKAELCSPSLNTGIMRANNGARTITNVPVHFIPVRGSNELVRPSMTMSTGPRTRFSTVSIPDRSTTIAQEHITPHVIRTPIGTTIQRKVITSPPQEEPLEQTRIFQTSLTSGRMIIPKHAIKAANEMMQQKFGGAKAVTPEQKILQLSKSGDLKVTKKMMTREDLAQRTAQKEHLKQQHFKQQQSPQLHIQKVQSGTEQKKSIQTSKQPPTAQQANITHVKQEIQDDDDVHLCPVTGNIVPSHGILPQNTKQGILQVHLMSEQQQKQQQQLQQQESQNHSTELDTQVLLNQHNLLTNEDDTPLLVTGEDGTVYQVAGKNAEGQTILVTQGPDGEQQFAYVAAAESGDLEQVLAQDTAAEITSQQQTGDHIADTTTIDSSGGSQYYLKTTQEDGTTHMVSMSEAELAQHHALVVQQSSMDPSLANQLCIQTGDTTDGQETNIPAEVVQAELPSPGGTRRVVLLLQDGTFMMTEMHDDEFKALNLTL